MMQHIVKYRGELMGIAALLILIYHYYTTTEFFLISVAPPLAYCGVDMFLSGFGLCFGYGKYKSVSAFYKRRISRIYPTYLTAIIIGTLAVTSLSVVDILLQSTTLPAYVDFEGLPPFNWYVPAIVLFYLLFPFIYSLISKGVRLIGRRTLDIYSLHFFARPTFSQALHVFRLSCLASARSRDSRCHGYCRARTSCRHGNTHKPGAHGVATGGKGRA